MDESHRYETIPFKKILNDLKSYFQNPVEGMRKEYQWNWPTNFFVQIIAGMISGLGAGIVSGSIPQIVIGFVLMPISSTLTISIVSGFFYYTFMFFFKRQIAFRKIFTLVILANLPLMALNMLSAYISPILVLGFAISGLLLIVGFVDSLKLPKKSVIKLIVGLFVVAVTFWVVNTIQWKQEQKEKLEKFTTPESLDILEKELEK